MIKSGKNKDEGTKNKGEEQGRRNKDKGTNDYCSNQLTADG